MNPLFPCDHMHEVGRSRPTDSGKEWNYASRTDVYTDLPKLLHQPGIQRTLRDHGYGLVYHAICLFTAPAFAGYSFQPNHRGRARAE